jgi:hypothetical protein
LIVDLEREKERVEGEGERLGEKKDGLESDTVKVIKDIRALT